MLSKETATASPAQPVKLHIAGEIPAGPIAALPTLHTGDCWRILTGGSVPLGVDSVAPQEIVQLEDAHIVLAGPVRANRNIRHRGEEVKKGGQLATVGQRITPGLLAALIMAGADTVTVHARPRVRVLVTGDEVRPSGSKLREGEIFDSNGPLVRNYLVSQGYPEPRVDHAGDVRKVLNGILEEALADSDLVITTGGVSVGDRDFIPDVAQSLGVKKVFWKVSQKPGKPLYYGLRGSTALLGLPGNPGAVLIGLLLHVRHVLDCMEGVSAPGAHFHHGRLVEHVAADALRDRLVRMEMSVDTLGQVQLLPLELQDSHMLSNLGTATALAHLPASMEDYPAGAVVRWTPLPGMCFI